MPFSPKSLLQASDCLAQSLSVSNDHATILLRTTEYDKVVRSVLKLTFLPSHVDALSSTNDIRNISVEDLGSAFTPGDSSRILNFLRNYEYQLSSESGAEYSYFNATPKHGPGLLKWLFSKIPTVFKAELISPASEKQIERAMPVPSHSMITETPKLYQQVVAPYIRSVVDSGSLVWVQNVVDGSKEAERLLLDTEHYVLNVDTKWKTHPDPFTISKDNWKNYKTALKDLYCLAIVKEKGLATIRDLRKRHIPILKDMMIQCTAAIKQIYNVSPDQLRFFFHYHPQFYHLHVHFTRLENETGCQVERAHLVADVIQNLELDEEFYSNRTMTYKVRSSDKLHKLINGADANLS
mmetsp:Transcript_31621/g.46663  ORF Transcript_31621/g.46663 Transcript_31621/m.46663 type:complete len:352 (-) Transcript_31621:200-1255(-)